MKNDLISRKAAIDALNEYFVRIGKLKRRGLTKGEQAISLDTVGAIKTLPSAQRWIPVTERLPEIGIPVLFCDDDGDIRYGFYDRSFLGGDTYWKEFYNEDRIKNVVAWMPKPEPYRGDGDNNG